MQWFIDLFHRAQTNQKLTVQERAILKAIQGAIIGFVLTNSSQLLPVLTGQMKFNLTADVVGTFLGGVILAMLKLWYGQQDAHLGDVLDAYAKQLEQKALSEALVPNNDGSIPALQFTVPVTTSVLSAAQKIQAKAAPVIPIANAAPAAVPSIAPVALQTPQAPAPSVNDLTSRMAAVNLSDQSTGPVNQ